MPQPSKGDDSATVATITRCRKLAKQLIAGRITFNEYCYNVTLAIVCATDKFMPDCVDSIPGDVIDPYSDYLRSSLEPVDFMPCPKPLLAGGVSEDTIERRMRELRPKYIRLYQLVRERGSQAAPSPGV